MQKLIVLIALVFTSFSLFASSNKASRQVIDFNYQWKFSLGEKKGAFLPSAVPNYNKHWQTVNVPHDWAVALPYTEDKAASSTGFKPGGIGWYRKHFQLHQQELNKAIWLEFDGVYNNAQVWINGHFAGNRPNGYSSFKIDVSEFAIAGDNLVAVKVDRTAYNDSRWYTGSGIYRNVRLIKTDANHIDYLGVQILTPQVSQKQATVNVTTQLNLSPANTKNLYLDVRVFDQSGELVKQSSQRIDSSESGLIQSDLSIKQPNLWQLDSPSLYTAKVTLRRKKQSLDSVSHTFGIRDIEFDPNRGFLLNGVQTKIKGVNLHHDAGVIGSAVPKEVWRYRLQKLKSIGVNGLRLSHNPHSPELLDLADEMGFLAIAEMFDDWLVPKKKSVVFLSDNAGTGESVESYAEHFSQWAEADLVGSLKRDFNHPSVIMWSIGNEIEWTYPYYAQSQLYVDGKKDYHGTVPPIYEPALVKANFEKLKGDKPDDLALTAEYLSNIVKQYDTSRPVTAGLVAPSVGYVSGYTDTLDIVGFNYRAQEYDIAHKTYPDKMIYGSENWGTWPEWKAALDREFIPGIFIWTGFAYKGEAGPWPRKGLEISLFDYAGNLTPRGHQFEGFWGDKPKVYLAAIEAEKSEYQYDATTGWQFTQRTVAPKQMQWVRAWEWYNVNETWNYQDKQNVVVHVYSNTEQSELFLNGQSLGKQNISDDNNRILLWQVPYAAGELKVVGYNQGVKVAEYSLNTHSEVASIKLNATKTHLLTDQKDVSHVHVQLLDKHGHIVNSQPSRVHFELEGQGTLIGVDNGWEMNVDNANDSVESHYGRALALIQSTDRAGDILLKVRLDNGVNASIALTSAPAENE